MYSFESFYTVDNIKPKILNTTVYYDHFSDEASTLYFHSKMQWGKFCWTNL